MIPYSIHVAILLAVCLLFYKLLLQKETYYRLNRVILLTCLVLAFILPLVPIPQQFSLLSNDLSKLTAQQPAISNSPTVTDVVVVPETQANVNAPVNTAPEPVAQKPIAAATARVKPQVVAPTVKAVVPSVPVWQQVIKWAFWLYWCGVAVFGANLLLQVIVLLFQAYKKPVMKDGIYRIVELDDDKAPCSFGNNIFINPSKYDWETYNQILIHEKVHIQQGHSFDLITAELMLVVQWFNPFAWLYRKELESNLEFLTDYSVLHQHKVEPADYQMSLLKVSVPNFSMSITTNYNQSLLKKRIVMMNAKRSNIHTMWKYFMLMPLYVGLLCGLNKPFAKAGTLAKFQQNIGSVRTIRSNFDNIDFSHGLWFATIKNDRIEFEFKADDNNENHSWTSSHDFKLSDFPNLPKSEKADFTLTREAGSLVFNGKFDGEQGYGHYKFTANKDYVAAMTKENVSDLEEDDCFSFFMADVKKDYIQFLRNNGFKDIAKYQIISMSSQKIDADYIKYWRKLGYTDLTTNELISLKSQKIDSTYVNDIRKAGYTDLTARQLISFKQQHITGDYINGLRKATVNVPGGAMAEKPTPQQIMSSKSMHIDSAYVTGFNNVNYSVSTYNQLSSLKSMGITPEYIKGFEAVGLKNIPYNDLVNFKSRGITPEYVKGFESTTYKNLPYSAYINFKSQGITPEYIKSFEAIGYKDIPFVAVSTFKYQGITPEYIKGFEAVGYKDMPYNTYGTFKTQGITPEFIKGFEDVGYKNIPYSSLGQLKTSGITPAFVKGFQDLGYKDIPYYTLTTLKSQGITPAFVKGFQDIGIKDIQLNNLSYLKTLTPEYIKAFQDLGYKGVTASQLNMLKREGITPEYVKGFNALGFTNISISELNYYKSSGLTPEFVTEMRQKGFDSKDLRKYLELKNFNSSTNTSTVITIGGNRGTYNSTSPTSNSSSHTSTISGQGNVVN